MIRRNLAKCLERLEERILPPRDIHLLRVVYSNADGPAVGGYTVGPGYGSGRHSLGGRKTPNTLHFLSFPFTGAEKCPCQRTIFERRPENMD